MKARDTRLLLTIRRRMQWLRPVVALAFTLAMLAAGAAPAEPTVLAVHHCPHHAAIGDHQPKPDPAPGHPRDCCVACSTSSRSAALPTLGLPPSFSGPQAPARDPRAHAPASLALPAGGKVVTAAAARAPPHFS